MITCDTYIIAGPNLQNAMPKGIFISRSESYFGQVWLDPGVGDHIVAAQIGQMPTQPVVDPQLVQGLADQQGAGVGGDAFGANLEPN